MNRVGGRDWLAAESDGVTGIDYLDRCLSTSEPPGRLYGLLGPIGIGKSTMGAMIAVEGAKKCLASHAPGEQPMAWVYFNFDGKIGDVENRLVSHGARISRNEPNRNWLLQDLSCGGAYRTYEIERAAELPRINGALLGERERLNDFQTRLWRRHLLCVGMTDAISPQGPPPGLIVAESLGYTSLSHSIAGVVIDYVGRAVKDYVGEEFSRIPDEIRQFIRDCRREVAHRWDCPVWLIHQLNGEANEKRPGDVQHHRDAADCRRFGDDLDACFVLGQRDPTAGALILQCTKSSVQPPGPTILRFDPHFATLVPAGGFRVDRHTSRIVVNTGHLIHFDPTFDDLPAAHGPT